MTLAVFKRVDGQLAVCPRQRYTALTHLSSAVIITSIIALVIKVHICVSPWSTPE